MLKETENVAFPVKSACRVAFSLVELSIVLVILGLLAGGILTGQSLIRAAQLRAIPVEFQQYQTAVMSFQDKYRQLPGDMRNATDFFGQAATCPPVPASPLTGRETCNGDGDGMIEAAGVTANELFTFWQHLSNAGMAEGSFTGSTTAGVYNAIAIASGVSAPESRIAKAVWWPYWLAEVTVANTTYIEGIYNNAFLYGTEVSATWPYNSVLTPEETWNIDTKIDDGQAGNGKMIVGENYYTTCYLLADGSAGSTSATVARNNIKYNLANKSKACILYFLDVF